MSMSISIKNYLGWYGVLAILSAYFLISFEVLKADSPLYQLLNLTGAIGIIIETLSKKDLQPAILNIVWALIAAVTLIRLIGWKLKFSYYNHCYEYSRKAN